MGIKTVVAVVPHDKHITLRHNLQKFNFQLFSDQPNKYFGAEDKKLESRKQ